LLQNIVELLARLSETPGPSGHEDEVRNLIIAELKKQDLDVDVDALGNVFAELRGGQQRPRILVCAHMDEVGFIIKFVEQTGYLRFGTLGMVDPKILPGQRVVIKGTEPYVGVIGSKPPHILTPEEMRKPSELGDLYMDFGASSREEATELGIEVGTVATFDAAFAHAYGTMVIGKALDNRTGCAVALKLTESLVRKPPSCSVVFAFTVQEELGLRGAEVAANRVTPDAALVLETAVAADSPDVQPKDRILVVGRGPAIRVMDASMITQRLMLEYMKKTAQTLAIPYQLHINLGGSTDAGRIHLSGRGIPTGVLSIPCRYLHSASLMLNLEDLNHLLNLSESTIRGIDRQTKFSFIPE
jgi:putative aminopeptidase FrvX